MSHLDADEVRAKNLKAMGVPIGTLYSDLLDEILWLHVVWRQYRVLFGTSQARVDLLDRASGFFFRIMQDTLWEAVLLHICRLTDPPRARRRQKDTLTLLRLPATLPESQLRKSVRSLIHQASDASEFARDWRDRHIAHRDLLLVQSQTAQPLAPASRAGVERVLTLFRDVVNAMESHYFGSPMVFDFVSPPNDAQALLYELGLARMIQDERDARLKAGEARPDDFKGPPTI